MKSVLLLSLLFISISIITQIPVSQVEGFLEVYHCEDTTSTYVEGFLNTAYGDYDPILVEAIKAQQALIKQLMYSVNKLTKTVDTFSNRIDILEKELSTKYITN